MTESGSKKKKRKHKKGCPALGLSPERVSQALDRLRELSPEKAYNVS